MTHLRALPEADPRTPLAEKLRRTPRAFTFEELATLSSPRKARTAVASGTVVRLAPDAYVAALHADSFAARADAALLWAGPRAALSGAAAMFVWGFIEDPPSIIEVVVPHAERPRGPSWIRIRRLRWTPPTARIRGVTVVGPHLAVIYGFAALDPAARADGVFRAVRSGLVSGAGLARALDRVSRVAARRELAMRIAAAARGAESYLEERSHRTVFHTAEFARLTPQHRITVEAESFRIDLYDRDTMTAIELDGDAFHADPAQRLRDTRRDAVLASVGILTVRLGYRDLTTRPEWCRDVVRRALSARGGASGPLPA